MKKNQKKNNFQHYPHSFPHDEDCVDIFFNTLNRVFNISTVSTYLLTPVFYYSTSLHNFSTELSTAIIPMPTLIESHPNTFNTSTTTAV